MKKKKILFVYGYNDSPESIVIDLIKKTLKNKYNNNYNIVSDYYAQYRPTDALKDLNNLVMTLHPDVVIGIELGGFLTAFLTNKKIKKILINPIIDPVEELSKYEGTGKDENGKEVKVKLVPDYIINFYKDFDKKLDFIDPNIFIINEKDKDLESIISENVIPLL